MTEFWILSCRLPFAPLKCETIGDEASSRQKAWIQRPCQRVKRYEKATRPPLNHHWKVIRDLAGRTAQLAVHHTIRVALYA